MHVMLFLAGVVGVAGDLDDEGRAIGQEGDDRVQFREVISPQGCAVQFEGELVEYDEAIGFQYKRLGGDSDGGVNWYDFFRRRFLNRWLLDRNRVTLEMIIFAVLRVLLDFLLEFLVADGVHVLVATSLIAARELEAEDLREDIVLRNVALPQHSLVFFCYVRNEQRHLGRTVFPANVLRPQVGLTGYQKEKDEGNERGFQAGS